MNSAITYEQRVWPDLVGRLLDCNYKDELNTEIDRHLIPVPWTNDGRLTVPYGDADLPYLKRSLFSSDSVLVGNSLQALVERAHKCRKAVDMLKYVAPSRSLSACRLRLRPRRQRLLPPLA